MKKLIHGYLSSCFYLKGGKLYKTTNQILNSKELTNNLTLIFGLTRKELKWYIKSWFKKQDKSIDYNKWWSKMTITFNTTFTGEMTHDLSYYYGVDVATEFEDQFACEIASMVDRQIVLDLLSFQTNNTPSFSVRYVQDEILKCGS